MKLDTIVVPCGCQTKDSSPSPKTIILCSGRDLELIAFDNLKPVILHTLALTAYCPLKIKLFYRPGNHREGVPPNGFNGMAAFDVNLI